MAQDTYNILFKGEVMPGMDQAEVKAAMGRLFKAPAEKIDALFAAEQTVIKKGLDRESAEKYRDALKKAGAIVYLRRAAAVGTASGSRFAQQKPVQQAQTQASQPSPSAASQPAEPTSTIQSAPAAADNEDGLSIAAMSGNLIRDEERDEKVPVEVDTSHIVLANQFDAPEQSTEPAPAAPDTSHMSIAETGADLNPDKVAPPPVVEPDTSALSLAPADVERITDPVPEQEFDIPDISSLDIEELGEILKPDEKPAAAQSPDLNTDFDLEDPRP